MKKYTLKITLLETEHEIYKEAVVPAGITFSQFAVLLNCILGYEGSTGYNFAVNEEQMFTEAGDFKLADEMEITLLPGHTTFIQNYLHKEDVIIFYDNGYAHRIDILDIEDCDKSKLEYAEVTFSCGNFPVPDVGSIYEWDDILSAYYDADSPVHEEAAEFLSEYEDYDILDVQEELAEQYRYTYGEPDLSCVEDIEQGIYDGNGIRAAASENPLVAMGTVKSVHFDLFDDDDEDYDDFDIERDYEGPFDNDDSYALSEDLYSDSPLRAMRAMSDLMEQLDQNGYDNEKKYTFMDYTKKDLLDLARDMGVKKVSSLNKAELTERLIDELYGKDRIRRFLMTVSPVELNSIERAIKNLENGDNCYRIKKGDGFGRLSNTPYTTVYAFDKIVICRDFLKTAKEIISEEGFHEKQRKSGFAMSALHFGLSYYGYMPQDIYRKLLAKSSEFTYTEEDIAEIFDSIAYEIRKAFAFDGKGYFAADVTESLDEVLEILGNKPYYIPTEEEILQFGALNYDPLDKGVRIVAKAIMDEGDNEVRAYAMAGVIAAFAASGEEFQVIINLMSDALDLDGMNFENALELFKESYNNFKMLYNRGHSPAELGSGN